MVYGDTQMGGTIFMFSRLYGYRFSGIVDSICQFCIIIILIIFGNLFADKYFFYSYIYPFCMLIIQISNFQSDYRNRAFFPKWCESLYRTKCVEVKWNKASRQYFARHPSQGKPVNMKQTKTTIESNADESESVK